MKQTKQNPLKKGLAVLASALLLVGLLPTAALASVGIAGGTPTLTVNTSVVSLAGQEWWVIGYNGSGVNPVPGHATLLLKNGNPYHNSAFRMGNSTQDDSSWTYYTGDSWYYEGSFAQPNDYNDSTLQRKMAELAANTGLFPAKEVAQITARDIGNDGIGGAAVNGQVLWPLSSDELTVIADSTVRSSGVDFWLRSPGSSDWNARFVDGGGNVNDSLVFNNYGVRPAFNLNLSSVLFTSAASGAGVKSATIVGGSLVGAAAPSNNFKFTFTDSSMAAPAVTLAGTTDGTSTLRFGYSGAATGTNQYLSCVLEQSGVLKYYGKLADCATGASGVFSIDTSGLTAGSYTLKIYSEQANGDNYSDFASATQDFTLLVDGSHNGTVTGGTSDNTRPTVTTAAPSGTGVALSGSVAITFSEAMNPAAGVGEVKLNTGAALAGGAWSQTTVANDTYTIPYSGLAAGTQYTINLSGFQDAASNEMTANSTHQFTTAAAIPTAIPVGNSITLPAGTITAGVNFTFTAAGDRQNATGATNGETRYIPVSWSVNPSGTFPVGGPYTATTPIESAGTYTLTVTYRLERWNGTTWIDTGDNDTKTATLTVLAANSSSSAPNSSSSAPNSSNSAPNSSSSAPNSSNSAPNSSSSAPNSSSSAPNSSSSAPTSSNSRPSSTSTTPATTSTSPQTGDSSNIGLWLALLSMALLAGGVATWQLMKQRKSHKAEK